MESQDLDRIRFFTRHFNDLQGLRYLVPLGLILLSLGGTTYFSSWPMLVRGAFILGACVLMLRAGAYYRRMFGKVEPLPAYAGQLESLSFSPLGPAPRMAGFELLTPAVRHAARVMGVAFALFFVLQAITPKIRVEEGDLLGQRYGITLDSVVEAEPSWSRGILSILQVNIASGSTVRAVGGQMALALCGSFLLGLWLWRERRQSQRHLLALGALLLGLSVFGTCLVYFVWEDRELPVRIINLILPALVHPWVALLFCGAAMVLAGLIDHWQLVRVFKPAVEEYS
jgi:hypothetical protein